jgi:flagellar biosynthetic protein FlhB|tara:strand:- start:519 stop:1616 length:1098 start_codon:yes stop_codon:yes gene_type:complete
MAQDSDTGEKTEEPTGKKLSEAVSRGNIAKSMDINTVALLAVALFLLTLFGGEIWMTLQGYLIQIYSDLGVMRVSGESLREYLLEFFQIAGSSVLPFMLGVMFFGILVTGTQTKFQLTPQAVSWNLAKLNPINGVRKTFSWKAWGEFVINLIKLSVVVALIINVVWDIMQHPVFHHPSYLGQVLEFISDAALTLLAKVLLAMIFIGVIDYWYQWWRTRDGLKMSVKDVKDETKNQDGDPHFKGEQRKRRMGIMQGSILEEVPEADVVVTNPVRLAVALKYDRETMKSPKIVAKGARYNALMIREIAQKNGVPLVENKPLAQMLFKFGRVGKEIPYQLFTAVAEILAYVYRTNRFRYFKKGRQVPA